MYYYSKSKSLLICRYNYGVPAGLTRLASSRYHRTKLRHLTRLNLKVQNTHQEHQHLRQPCDLAPSIVFFIYISVRIQRCKQLHKQLFSPPFWNWELEMFTMVPTLRETGKQSDWPSVAKIAPHMHKVEKISTRIASRHYPQCTTQAIRLAS